jgi:hypothetical protein
MPIVTEPDEQARRRRFWPLWLALGLVLLLLSGALVVPAVRPVEVSIGSRRYRVEVGEVTGSARRVPIDPPPGFQHDEYVLPVPCGWWSLRIGRYYYRFWYQYPW